MAGMESRSGLARIKDLSAPPGPLCRAVPEPKPAARWLLEMRWTRSFTAGLVGTVPVGATSV